MFDIVEAGKTVLTLMSSPDIGMTFNTPMIPDKKKWETQIEGAYDLIYPYLNEDFPTRNEVYAYATELFHTHHNMNYHWPLNWTFISQVPTIATSIPGFSYRGDSVLVRAGSKVNIIGYNL